MPKIPFPLLAGALAVILLIAGAMILSGNTGSLFPGSTPNATPAMGADSILPVNGLCSEGLFLCSGTCVDLMTDHDNCGGCGFAVPYGETCINGVFSSSVYRSITTTPAGPAGTQLACTESGMTSCSGSCRNLLLDTLHCGSCGNACPSGQACRDGRCMLTGTAATTVSTTVPATLVINEACSGRETLCGDSCVDVMSDKKNCGVCGRACGDQEICVNARCGPACTESGMSLCDDTCVDLDSDIDNCGSCGTECETFLPDAKGALCNYGACVISGCRTDYADCDKNTGNGCEIFLKTDAANCGSCGTKCSPGQVCYNRKCITPGGG